MINREIYYKAMADVLNKAQEILDAKRNEYATEDLLHNFNVAAVLKNENPRAALAGMMAKHTVSIYDMCMSNNTYPSSLWDEKIVDHINYLLLLRAVVTEEYERLEVCENVG